MYDDKENQCISASNRKYWEPVKGNVKVMCFIPSCTIHVLSIRSENTSDNGLWIFQLQSLVLTWSSPSAYCCLIVTNAMTAH